MDRILILSLMTVLYFRPSESCQSHDQVCVGAHGTSGNCCDGTYCHKGNPTWAEGRCYFVTGASSTATCIGFDGACKGTHGTSGNCCSPYYCHKNDPTWAEGRCYNPIPVPGGSVLPPGTPAIIPVPASSFLPGQGVPAILAAPVAVKIPCSDHDGECTGVHGTQGNCCANLYCHKGNPDWLHGRCYFSNPAAQNVAAAAVTSPPVRTHIGLGCVLHDSECIGDPGTKGDCCDGTYCHKDDFSWAKGKCRNNPIV